MNNLCVSVISDASCPVSTAVPTVRVSTRHAWPIVLLGMAAVPNPLAAASFKVDTNVFDGNVQVIEQRVAGSPLDAELLAMYPDAVAGTLATLQTSQGGFSAGASADDRVLRVSATGSWGDFVTPDFPFSGAGAEIRDRFMIVDSLNGTASGTAKIEVYLSGAFSQVNATGQYQMTASICEFQFTGLYPCLEISQQRDFGPGANFDWADWDLPQLLQSNTAVLPFDTLLEVTMTLGALGGPASRGAGNVSLNLADSAVWGGIRILDDQGQSIPGLQVVSASGLNWLEPATTVPAPGAAWLLGTGLAALALRRKLRDRRS